MALSVTIKRFKLEGLLMHVGFTFFSLPTSESKDVRDVNRTSLFPLVKSSLNRRLVKDSIVKYNKKLVEFRRNNILHLKLLFLLIATYLVLWDLSLLLYQFGSCIRLFCYQSWFSLIPIKQRIGNWVQTFIRLAR